MGLAALDPPYKFALSNYLAQQGCFAKIGKMARSIKIITLGCKVNQYESQFVREGFLRMGYEEVPDGETPDLIVVNTCTVTADSEAKGRKLIRRLAHKNPSAEIVVMGCYAARNPKEAASLPGVVEVVTDKRNLPDFLARRGLPVLFDGISTFEDRHRAWVKVQDGCRQRCSYCIIPQVRPHLFSRPIHEVLEEIKRLTDAGFAEIVLTGIHLGQYGRENANQPDLTALIREIIALPGEFRVRLSSIEAAEVTPELIRLTAERPDRLCPHFHLPLQSGADTILRAMRRPYVTSEFLERCERIRTSLDQPALTTDIIVGFPGETEDDFNKTCALARRIGFAKIHVFRFSPREGTPAALLPRKVPQRTHQEWASELNRVGVELRHQYLKTLRGRMANVLIEGNGKDEGTIYGTSERYIQVELEGPVEWENKIVEAKIDRVERDFLRGTAT